MVKVTVDYSDGVYNIREFRNNFAPTMGEDERNQWIEDNVIHLDEVTWEKIQAFQREAAHWDRFLQHLDEICYLRCELRKKAPKPSAQRNRS